MKSMSVKKSAIILTLRCLILVLVAAQDDARAGGPVARFDQTVHDFGTVAADAKVEFAWPVFNDGDEPLEIVNTFPSCGCTASLIETDAIGPGERGILRVTFDAAGQFDDVRKTITVVTTDPDRPRTILTIRAKVLPPTNPRVSSGHPPMSGQSMLVGPCGGCHAQPAGGKSGAALYSAVCAMCHGDRALGGLAYGLRDAAYLSSRDDRALADAIAYGTTNPRMPGFSKDMGGPLDPSQVDSLVKLIRTWGPTETPREADSERPDAGP